MHVTGTLEQVLTVVAAFQINTRPVVIGDLLLSRQGIEADHVPIPTLDNVEEVLPKEWQRIVTGLHRKVCIVNRNLAVGWTGNQLYCTYFVARLHQLLKDHPLKDVDELLNYLKRCKRDLIAYTEKDKISDDDLMIIGCYVDQHSRIHNFEYSFNKQVDHFGLDLVRGSGEDDLTTLLNVLEFKGSGSEPASLPKVATTIVDIVSIMLGEEVATGNNIRLLYGGGYDIVIWTDDGFKYLTDILYVPIFMPEVDGDLVKMNHPSLYFKYTYLDDVLAITRIVSKKGIVVLTLPPELAHF